MSTTATRLINLIMLLQRQPNQKAAQLAAELGVSVRTLHRYFVMLDEMGIPVYSERGPYGGFSLVKGYRMPPLVLTPEEAVAVYLGASLVEETWGELYRAAACGALAKLDNLLPDEQRHEAAWARRTLVATGMHRSDQDALAPSLEKLRLAARQYRRVRLSYQSQNRSEPALRDLDPYALVHRWGWWYVIGFCHLRQAMRTFRVDRIQALELLETAFEPPSDFDLRNYLEHEPQAQPQITARMRFAPHAARVAQEGRSYWETLREQEDGSIEVSFDAPTLEWAASTALAYGPLVEVLDPPELRRMVGEWAQVVLEKYQS
ncbi:MAG: YafY family protein [Anaerolineales bacterium]|jgi:predicted DNA-binding transcriptional regulator YafY